MSPASKAQLAEWRTKIRKYQAEQRKHPVNSPRWCEYGHLSWFYERRVAELSGRFR